MNIFQSIFKKCKKALYDATKASVSFVQSLRTNTTERRNYAVVLMTDGDDTTSLISFTQMMAALPDGTSSDQVHVHTIAYGEQPSVTVLQSISSKTNGKFFKATTSTIDDIYQQINLEF